VHAGEEEQAVRLARQTIDAFENAHLDAVIINAAGCGSNVKEYGHLLRDDPGHEAAASLSARTRDLFFVALDEEVLVGTVMGGYDGHRGWVYSVAVRPAERLGPARRRFAKRKVEGQAERERASANWVRIQNVGARSGGE
jgi:hypothetical protein